MPETNKTNSDPDKANDYSNRASDAGLWWIVVSGITLLVALLIASIILPHMAERVKFFTVNALSICVLAAIVIQTYIYRRQWETMQQQSDAMKKQLDAMMHGQRAYITVSGYEVKKGEPMGIAKFELKVENSGTTPANSVEIFDMGEVRQCSPVPDISPTKWTQLGIIAPRGYAVQVIDVTKEMSKMVSRTYHHQGIIRYRDIFGECHCTRFCLEVSGMHPFRGIPCKEGGNEAD